ncbi:MAG TPA: nucleotide exchange factor GrpE [Candidatus Pacearchaeota archaeon]|nr:nucleotide exchange factor GrpE [Candidatus Pacearchaeota archaeon]
MKKENKEKEVKELEEQLEVAIKEKEEYLNSWKRDLANYINYKNKECERTQDLIISVKEIMFERLISILDNMSLAEKSIDENLKDNISVKGLLLVKKQLEDFFRSEGLEEINETEINFNPEIHEVLEEVESVGDSQKVIEIIQKGYKINGKVLRPAKVKIIK